MKHLGEIPNLQETEQATAERQIMSAWRAYSATEKHGLEFGRVCFEWQQKLQGGIGRKGKGLYPMLDTLNIPPSTAYWWINRYKESKGLLDVTISNEKPIASVLEKLENVSAPSLDITLTPLNVADTRCLSMAKERLKFVWGKLELLLAAKNDPNWDQNQVHETLLVYYRALQDFSKFIQSRIDIMTEHGIKG